MSSRALRKLQGRGEVMNIPTVPDEAGSESDDTVDEKPVMNKFSLLHDFAACSDDNDDSEPTDEAILDADKNHTKPVKKKRNRKKKRKTVTKATDDIDETLQAIENTRTASSSTSSPNNRSSFSSKSIFTVEHRLLNPDNELRKIFGTRALMGDSSFRRRNQGTVHKGIWLTQPQNNWARLGRTGISMQQLETKNGCQYFVFVHAKDYQEIQFKFLDAVDSADHNNIARLLENNSYHVDSLLTFSDVYKIHEDLKMARELIERALYCLERSFHTCFNLTTGTCRLLYKYRENRCLFLALYKHMNYVSQRGCNRTALELCKVLLSLDPVEDPLCSVFLFDFFALRALEYNFLVKFSQEWDIKRNLMQLPNMAFSVALAHFHLCESGESSIDKADEVLQNALIMFPSVLLLLLEKCSVQPDEKVKSHSYFNEQAAQSTHQGLALLCHMFVERNFTLWKSTEVLAWLEKNVHIVLERVDRETSFVEDCAKKRKIRYRKPPLNVYRHAMLSELPEVSSLLPLEIRMGTMLSHDPLPPSDSIAGYNRPARTSTGIRPRNPVSLFFHSLLPDNNIFDENLEEQPDLAEVGGSVQILLDAMRGLIQHFHEPMRESEEEDFVQDWD